MNASALPPCLWNGESLSAALGIRIPASLRVTGVSIDTRSLEPGDLFIALRGPNHDGHDHIGEALNRGAAAVLTENPSAPDARGPGKGCFLATPDNYAALAKLAAFARARFRGRVIAITGSVGKTTLKNMLHLVLAAYGPTHASEKSLNNHLGVPLTLARLPENARFAVLEAGMNHVGEIRPLARLIQPEAVVITNISASHLGHMKTLKATAREKAELLSVLPAQKGLAILPAALMAGPYGRLLSEALPTGVKPVTPGFTPDADPVGTDLEMGATESRFTLKTADSPTDFRVMLHAPGRPIVENALLALGVLKALKLSFAPGIRALERFQPEAGRGERHGLRSGVTLLDESYNASPASMQAALQTLSLLPSQRKIAVLGDMKELGEYAEQEHLNLLPFLVQENILCFFCGPEMKKIFEKLPPSLQGGWAERACDLRDPLGDALQKGDAVLLKGSNSMRLGKLIPWLKGRVE